MAIDFIKKSETTEFEYIHNDKLYMVQWHMKQPDRDGFLVKIFIYNKSELAKWEGKSEWKQISADHRLYNHATPTQFASIEFLKKQLNIKD